MYAVRSTSWLAALTVGVSALVGVAPATAAQRPTGEPTVVTGFDRPESAQHDRVGDVYLVSNISGHAVAKDDNGFVSRVAPDGRVLDLKWIDGADPAVTLHGPKGIRIVGNTVYVADIDTVRLFDRRTGRPTGQVELPGTTFLNDLAADPAGNVYVSDTSRVYRDGQPVRAWQDAVYRIDRRLRVTRFAFGTDLNQPNGLVWTARGLYAVSLTGNELYRLDRAGTKRDVVRLPGSALDGLEVDAGGLLASSNDTASVYRVDRRGRVSTPLTGLVAPAADFSLDRQRRRLLVPMVAANRLELRDLR